MSSKALRLITLFALGFAAQAGAQEIKPLCPDRGAFQACTVDPGHVQVEVALADWFDDQDSTLLVGDTVVRLGLSETTEVQLGISPLIRRTYGKGHGDLRVALRHRLVDGDFSLAVQPTLIIPLGSKGFSGQRLIPGLAVGMTYDLTPRTQFYLSPYGVKGEKLLGGTFLGINQSLTSKIGTSAEIMIQHEKDNTQSSFDLTATYTVDNNLEFDTSANMGLTRTTPAVELVVGLTRRF